MLTPKAVILKLSLVLGALFVNCLLAMLIQYIASLQNRMKTFNIEKIKLLNAMHEGLLILSNSEKQTRTTMFCNQPG